MRRQILNMAVGVCVISRCLAPSGVDAGGARAPAVRVSCVLSQPQDGVSAETLCAALARALVQAAPGVRVTQGEEGAAFAVVAQVTSLNDRGLTAHLVWQPIRSARPAAGPDTGPDVQLRVSDKRMGPAFLDRFAVALINSAPDLQLALRTLSARR